MSPASDQVFKISGCHVASEPEMWIFRSSGKAWAIGSDPAKWRDSPNLSIRRRDCDSNVRLKLLGMYVLHASYQAFDVDPKTGKAICLKNRFGSMSSVDIPFTSIEEACIISASRGWPQPLQICG